MGLRRLCKAASSTEVRDCPAIYVDADPAWMVGQGKRLDATATGQLLDLAADEVASRIPTETILRAAGLFLAERGHPGVLAEIESYLAGIE
jgi:hypothetical protein